MHTQRLLLCALMGLSLACPPPTDDTPSPTLNPISPTPTSTAAGTPTATAAPTTAPTPTLTTPPTPTATNGTPTTTETDATPSPTGGTPTDTAPTPSGTDESPSPTDTAAPTPTPELECVDRIVASYDFEDPSTGTTAADGSGSGLDLSLIGGATFGSGVGGTQALSFTTADGKAQVADNDALDLEESVSLEAWIYMQTLPPSNPGTNWWTVASKGDAVSIGTDRNYSLYIRSDGLVNWSLSRPDMTAQGECRYGTQVLEAQRWYHIVVTASPEAGGTKAYFVDGVLDQRMTNCQNTSLVPNSGAFYVGDSLEPNHNFKGRIDGLRIRDCALSDAEVADLHGGASSR